MSGDLSDEAKAALLERRMTEIESWRMNWVDPRLERAEGLHSWRRDTIDPAIVGEAPESLKGQCRRLNKIEAFQSLVLAVAAVAAGVFGFFGDSIRRALGLHS